MESKLKALGEFDARISAIRKEAEEAIGSKATISRRILKRARKGSWSCLRTSSGALARISIPRFHG